MEGGPGPRRPLKHGKTAAKSAANGFPIKAPETGHSVGLKSEANYVQGNISRVIKKNYP